MLKFTLIFIGGGFGACLRYLSNLLFANFCGNFPVSTMFVNILGSFLMGILTGLFSSRLNTSPEIQSFLTVGLLGGLTTFSTFSSDIWHLFTGGELIKGIIYTILSLFLSLGVFGLGVYILK